MRKPTWIPTALACLAALAGVARAEAPFSHAVPMQQQSSGNYYVAGTLTGGVRTDFLVDTGSGYVSLSPATFARLRGQPGTERVRDIVGSMANGATLKVPVYRVARLELAGDCVLTDVEVTVLPGSSRDILGLSALKRMAPFALDLEPARLLVSGCGAPVERGPADFTNALAAR